MAATRDDRHDEGSYEASLGNRNWRVGPINSDGLDPEGRREAGQLANDEDQCRFVRSRDLAVLGFTSNSCDSSSTLSRSTSSSDTASEISEPRNEVTEESATTMHQPMCASQATKRLPSGGPGIPRNPSQRKSKNIGQCIYFADRGVMCA